MLRPGCNYECYVEQNYAASKCKKFGISFAASGTTYGVVSKVQL